MDMGADVARIAYDTGRVTGRGALDQTAIIDNHPNLDLVPNVDVHDDARPFATRARMDTHLGGHGSQALWQGEPAPADAFDPAEAWLNAIEAHGTDGPSDAARVATVAAARPASASDRCTLPRGIGVPGKAPCSSLVVATPRIAAGGPASEDVIKCSLKPADTADYPSTVAPADVAALRRVFPTGVCNWGVAGVGETARSQVWLSFGDGSTPPSKPFALKNVVARSAASGASVLGATSSAGAGGSLSRLPATGADTRWALVVVAIGLAALTLRRRTRGT
jgi:hypothetical protein